MDTPIRAITAKVIDAWIDGMKDGLAAKPSSRRGTFRHELEVLSAILRFYDNRGDDEKFVFPIKERHWQDVSLNKPKAPKSKDLTETEFWTFQAELAKTKYGHILGPLAVVQYFQALRISEAGGIYWEDVKLNPSEPQRSRLLIQRKVVHTRASGAKPFIKAGYKTSGSYGDVKEQPLFPQSHSALEAYRRGSSIGLIFHLEGEPIPYRTVQHYYDLAFERAGLPYSATHVLRHGWTREVYNANPDMDVAKQLLGDKSDEAAKVYAIRRASALTAVADKQWELAAIGRKQAVEMKNPARCGA